MSFIDWEQRFEQWKEANQNAIKWKSQLDVLEKELQTHQQEEAFWGKKLTEYSRNREKLDRLTWNNLFHSLTGKKQDQIDEWDEAVVKAKLKFEEAAATVDDIEHEVKEKRQALLALGNLERQYERLFEEKQQLVHDQDSILSDQLYELINEKEELKAYLKELKEAIRAGEAVIHSLRRAEDSMTSAKNWGTYDMLGGGMIATAVKRSRMNDGNSYIHEAQRRMRHFEHELKDVKLHSEIQVDTGSMLKFADYFIDGLIVDWIVQGKIQNSREQISKQISQVNSVLSKLRQQEITMQNKLSGKQSAYQSLVIGAS